MRRIRVTRRQYRIISYLYRMGGFIAILGLLLGYSILIGKPIEFALIFLPYFITKGFYEKQYHAESLRGCVILSIMIFAFAVTVAMPVEYSISISAMIGLGLAYVSSKAGVIKSKLKEYETIAPAYYAMINKPKFSCASCTEEELIAKCRELRYSEEKTALAIEFFIKKTKQNIIAERYCIEPSSVAMRKWRMKKDLEK